VCHWDPSCTVYLFENLVKPHVLKAGDPDQAAIEKGAEAFHRNAKVLNDQLKGKKFITGERVTLADFSIGATLPYADKAQFPLESYGEIKRWYGTLGALPSWQKTLAQCAMPAPAAAAA
jgi:glutathione S-transferase